jgi:uncharacterized membrane protein
MLPLALLLLGLFLFPVLAHEGPGFWGAGVCHRIVERSFLVGGIPLPLCARCTGLHLGFLTSTLVSFWRGRRRPACLPPGGILVILFLFLLLVGLDGVNSLLTLFPILPPLYEPHNSLRLISGTLEGITFAGILIPILHMSLWRDPQEIHSIPNLRELGLIVLATVPLNALVLWSPPLSLYPLTLLSLSGLFLSLGVVNTLLVAVLTRRAGHVDRWVEAAALIGWGGVLAIIEVAAMSWLRFSLTGSFSFSLL